MPKVGDQVILKYPEKDKYPTNNNANYAIREGYLTKGKAYKIQQQDKEGFFVIISRIGFWHISGECFENKTKRNLPEWF